MILEYIWLDSVNNFRSKIMVLHQSLDLTKTKPPIWNYDGSSTGQTKGEITEVILKPVFVCLNPFLCNITKKSYIVLCATYTTKDEPLENNNYDKVEKLFNDYKHLKPWYGYEQEYFITDCNGVVLGYNKDEKQGKYYCSIGSDRAFGRGISDNHLQYCLYSGLLISGTNAEVAPGQWEFQIGPVEGINGPHQLLVARYILVKLAERYNLLITFDPKPLEGDWNGSGCHVNYSTDKMRKENGLDDILRCIKNLEKSKDKIKNIYGEGNERRLTGKHETSKMDEFSFDYGTRHTSIRIGFNTYTNKCGYFEDRRPASNVDPYLVSGYLLENSI